MEIAMVNTYFKKRDEEEHEGRVKDQMVEEN